MFDPANDIVAADLVLVMDKYTAADVLREVRWAGGRQQQSNLGLLLDLDFSLRGLS